LAETKNASRSLGKSFVFLVLAGVPLRPLGQFFTVVFYGVEMFRCKTAQLCATRCESEMTEFPSVSNSV
jgi:hypothetical protein